MSQGRDPNSVTRVATQIDKAICALPIKNSPGIRNIRRKYSVQLKHAGADFILALSMELLKAFGHRSVAYELIL